MNDIFKNAEWIWQNTDDNKDEYVQFTDSFFINEEKSVYINISADSNYTLWVNGNIAACMQYPDYPWHKVYDKVDISKRIKQGENKIAVLCWYYGESSSCYIKNKPGLIYEVYSDNDILAASGTKTVCRIAKDYISYSCEQITGQLGFTYHYDMAGYDKWNKENYRGIAGFHPAVKVYKMPGDFFIRPVKANEIGKRTPAKIISQGTFSQGGGVCAAEEMQHAGLYFKELTAMSGNSDAMLNGKEKVLYSKEHDGIYFIVDLLSENCGFLDLNIYTESETQIDIAFGEHLADGRVRSYIDGRRFYCSYKSKKGWQCYTNTLRRFGLRYLEVFVHNSSIKLKYFGIKPVNYPQKEKGQSFNNKLRNDICSASIRTLKLCMHDHYEDCPWREQALYSMDSRNQMLYGYFAFEGFEFQRASLELIGLGQRKDRHLPICAPCDVPLTIPSFSLMYITQMKEYILYSGDLSLAKQMYTVMKNILSAFLAKLNPNGLIDNFKEEEHWNYYEWSDGLDGFYTDDAGKYVRDHRDSYDAAINCFLSLALMNMAYICRQMEKTDDEKCYTSLHKAINKAIFKEFYNKEKGMFKSYKSKNEQHYSALVNSLCVLCGASPDIASIRICDLIINKDSSLVPATLSMEGFCYDAMLKTNKEKYTPLILNDIDETFAYMLANGATTFWETIEGEQAFDRAGSLCHGWSALPLYYYNILL